MFYEIARFVKKQRSNAEVKLDNYLKNVDDTIYVWCDLLGCIIDDIGLPVSKMHIFKLVKCSKRIRGQWPSGTKASTYKGPSISVS